MNKNMKIWLMLATLVVVALVAAWWSTIFSPLPTYERLLFIRPYRPPFQGDIELYYTARTVISSINITLLIFLLGTYVNIYNKTKADFTFALMLFSLVLLFYALASNPLVHWLFGFRAFGLGPFAMLPDLFTCIALSILLYLTVKY